MLCVCLVLTMCETVFQMLVLVLLIPQNIPMRSIASSILWMRKSKQRSHTVLRATRLVSDSARTAQSL